MIGKKRKCKRQKKEKIFFIVCYGFPKFETYVFLSSKQQTRTREQEKTRTTE
jgi:hypothetical protein